MLMQMAPLGGIKEYTASFLIIAGGGAGANRGSGAGAGGYRSSWNNETSGGGASAQTALNFVGGTVYTITVGAGGSQPTCFGCNGGNGIASTITGANFTTVSTVGGARGGWSVGQYGWFAPGYDGGCGSGAAYGKSPGNGTTGEGYNGGNYSYNGPVGGGGGTGATGGSGSWSSSGSGGAGTTSTITGSSVQRGGGGGGSAYAQNKSPGGAGAGGGGAGGALTNSWPYSTSGGNGTANTGGGGGGSGVYSGSYANYGNGGTGGSGVCILRMATSDYSGTTTGSPTVTTDGSDTILTFNSSGSYTA